MSRPESGTTARPDGVAALVLHPADDVATALREITAGEWVRVQGAAHGERLQVCEDIGLCHKLALHALETGQPVRKYGEVIGLMSQPVAAGAHVHIHNLQSASSRRSPKT